MVDDNGRKAGLLSWLRKEGSREVLLPTKPSSPADGVSVVKFSSTSPPLASLSTPSVSTPPGAPPEDAARALGEAKLERDVGLRYLDAGEVARGGMGSIRRVFDENLQRSVAMKVLFPEHREDPRIRQRFLEEAQIMGQLEHPNIVPVHDFGEDEGTRFFTMLYVRGKTLTELLSESDGVDTHEDYFRFLHIFLKVCDAVAFAHSRGVVHRDLKPDNIMVGNFGEVYLMDWGIARLLGRTGGLPESAGKTLTMPALGVSLDEIQPVAVRRETAPADETGQIIGTFFYMAPEQALADHDRIDERTDVFLLGGVLYEILTRQPPYVGSTVVDVVRQAQQCVIPPPGLVAPEARVPQALAEICMKCLRKESTERYQSALDLKKDIELFLRGGASFPSVQFRAGDHLMNEGDVGDEVYIIRKGTVQVYQTDKNGRRRGLATLGPGNVVGEASVLQSAARTASVVAVDEVLATTVTRKQLEHELGLNSWMGQLVKALAERFVAAQDRAHHVEEQNTTLQLANWVLQYLVLYGHTGPSGRREVQWSPLCQAAVHQFQKPEAEIRAILQGANAFAVDDERDALWFAV